MTALLAFLSSTHVAVSRARWFLAVLVGSCLFFIGYMAVRKSIKPWMKRRQQRRLLRILRLKQQREYENQRMQIMLRYQAGRTHRQMPLDVSNRGMW